MGWYAEALDKARRHPTITGLRERGGWHRSQSQNFRDLSVQSMRQHEGEAESLEATATYLEMEMVARAGMHAGEYRAVCVGRSAEVGRYIQVETDQGWNPDYFWCEIPMEASPSSEG